jgi:sulfate adenylyltransferase subunit 1
MKLMTCGSVDDGKSTLIGRLLLDSAGGLTLDQRQRLSNQVVTDLASITDGLEAEKAQGITIDIAYRYFNTPKRRFVIADCPGHEQYTRNMITAASTMDAALILVDVTKLNVEQETIDLLVQTKRHALLTHLMQVPHLVFVVNKLDAVSDAETVFHKVSAAINRLARHLKLSVASIVPVSALCGTNVVQSGFAPWYQGPSLLDRLHGLPQGGSPATTPKMDPEAPALLSVQWIELAKTDTLVANASRRVIWGQLAQGELIVGDQLVDCQGLTTRIAALFNTVRQPIGQVRAQLNTTVRQSTIGIVLDQERDVSRGDWLGGATQTQKTEPFKATLAWLDIDSAPIGRQYWLRHAHRWTKATLLEIGQVLDIHTLQPKPAQQLQVNDIAQVTLELDAAIPIAPYRANRYLGSMVLVDTAHRRTVGAVLAN